MLLKDGPPADWVTTAAVAAGRGVRVAAAAARREVRADADDADRLVRVEAEPAGEPRSEVLLVGLVWQQATDPEDAGAPGEEGTLGRRRRP